MGHQARRISTQDARRISTRHKMYKEWRDLVSPEGGLVRGDQRGPVGVEVVDEIG
jgi:hypothetical protein